VKLIYERVFPILDEAHDAFRVNSHSLAKNAFLDLIEEGDSADDREV